MRLRTIELFTALVIAPTLALAHTTGSPGSTTVVEGFSVTGKRTVDVLRALAERSQTVIGLSGVLIGEDDKAISITSERTSLQRLPDEICRKDPRYRWQDMPDGNIGVEVGKPLDLIDVHVASAQAKELSSLVMWIMQLPGVELWRRQSNCQLATVISGSPVPHSWKIDIDMSYQPLWAILNQVSAQTKEYFWSLVEFSDDPCVVNVAP